MHPIKTKTFTALTHTHKPTAGIKQQPPAAQRCDEAIFLSLPHCLSLDRTDRMDEGARTAPPRAAREFILL